LSQIDATFGAGLKAEDRPSRLTYMTLRQFAGENMLVDCKEYFEHHAHLACCFDDLRLHLQKLSRKDSCAFMEFVSSHTKGSYQSAIDVSNVCVHPSPLVVFVTLLTSYRDNMRIGAKRNSTA
jgi:hypothetical protein